MDREILKSPALNSLSNSNIVSNSYFFRGTNRQSPGVGCQLSSRNIDTLAVGAPESCWWLMAGLARPDPPASTSNLHMSRASDVLSSSSVVTNSQREADASTGSGLSEKVESDNSVTFVGDMTAVGLNGGGSSGSGFDESHIIRPLSVTDSRPQLISTGLRVAYQGVPGAYSEAAAAKAYPDCEPVPCEQFEAAFQAVELWLVDRAVLPIENSLGGSIHRNYDLLLRHRLHIVGEVQLSVNHCLLALPGTQIGDLKRVLSHPQALAQCEATLMKLGVTRESVHDTAGAAQMIASQKSRDAGAIASARAADIYGLDILADGIQDDPDNITRFLILAREPIIPRTDRPFKTSIVFTLEIGPGVLFKALSVFALREINLTKIESRPQKNKPLWESGKQMSSKAQALVDEAAESGYHHFDYLFYIDFQASMAEPRAQNALRHLQEFAPFLRVLGSFPMDVSPIAKL